MRGVGVDRAVGEGCVGIDRAVVEGCVGRQSGG